MNLRIIVEIDGKKKIICIFVLVDLKNIGEEVFSFRNEKNPANYIESIIETEVSYFIGTMFLKTTMKKHERLQNY